MTACSRRYYPPEAPETICGCGKSMEIVNEEDTQA